MDDEIYMVSDKAGNSLNLEVRDRDKLKKDKFAIYSFQYNNAQSYILPSNHFDVRYKKEDVVRAIHLHNEGLSLFQVKDYLWQHEGVKVSRETIREWCNKFSIFLKSDKWNLSKNKRTDSLR